MDIIIFPFLIPLEDKIKNLQSKGIIYFRLETSPYICFLSHDMSLYYWESIMAIDYNEETIDAIHTRKKLTSFVPDESQCSFKLVKLGPSNWWDIYNSINFLIKIHSREQIKKLKFYDECIVIYATMFNILHPDVIRYVIHLLFWLKINEIGMLGDLPIICARGVTPTHGVAHYKKLYGNGYIFY